MSLFTTISGIANNQAMLDVIGDNIANINTTGFKASKISFESIFSNTLSSGSPATGNSGGINPKQVGLGVTISEISRNFGRGSIQSTGRSSDLNIQGEGFFTLMDSDGKMFLSRAGNFSVDSDGNLVNPKGLKVVGTSNTTSAVSGTSTVQIPTALVLSETNIISGSGTDVTAGTSAVPLKFTMTVNGTAKQIDVLNTDTMQDIVNKINSELTGSTAAINSSNKIVLSGTDTVSFGDVTDTSNFATVIAATPSASNSYTSTSLTGGGTGLVPAAQQGNFTMSINGAAPVTITVAAGDTYNDVLADINTALGGSSVATINASNQMVITGSDNIIFAAGTSTFPTVASFTHDGTYTTVALADTPKVDISEADPTSDNNYKVTSYSIGSSGAVEATYSNGARLTVTGDPVRTLKYTSSGSQDVIGANITQTSGIAVDPSQLQIQLAQVINPKGLQSVGGNMFSLSSVAGAPSFAIGNAGGLGSIDAGSLEASNVDLPTEFANMILAQKAVEANSRAFSVQNQIMDTIVNLGR